RGPVDLDPFGEHEAALELAGGDAPIEIDPVRVILLLAAHSQLIVFELDFQLFQSKAGHRQGDPQAVIADLLDIIGGVAFRAGLGDPVQGALELVEAEQQRAVEERQTRHQAPPFERALSSTPPPGPPGMAMWPTTDPGWGPSVTPR